MTVYSNYYNIFYYYIKWFKILTKWKYFYLEWKVSGPAQAEQALDSPSPWSSWRLSSTCWTLASSTSPPGTQTGIKRWATSHILLSSRLMGLSRLSCYMVRQGRGQGIPCSTETAQHRNKTLTANTEEKLNKINPDEDLFLPGSWFSFVVTI